MGGGGPWPPGRPGRGSVPGNKCCDGAEGHLSCPLRLPQSCRWSPLTSTPSPGACSLPVPASRALGAIAAEHCLAFVCCRWTSLVYGSAGGLGQPLVRGSARRQTSVGHQDSRGAGATRASQAGHLTGLHREGCPGPLDLPSLCYQRPPQTSSPPRLLFRHCYVCAASLKSPPSVLEASISELPPSCPALVPGSDPSLGVSTPSAPQLGHPWPVWLSAPTSSPPASP